MTFQRLAAIAVIFVGASIAWSVLGSSVLARTGQFDGRMEREVQLLWGAPHRQIAPNAWIQRPGVDTETVETKAPNGRVVRTTVSKPVLRPAPAALESTRATVNLNLQHRQKGLLWYATYGVTFKGTYTFRNPDAEARAIHVRFPLPAQNALLDDFVFSVDGKTMSPGSDVSKEINAFANAAPGGAVTLNVQYRSRGLSTWTYVFAEEGAAQVRDFNLAMHTNFRDINFPAGTMSPGDKSEAPGGWALTWAFANLISGQAIGLELPERLNPGPFAARVTFFAPVSLLFFLSVMVILGTISGPSLHPMHYWFIAAAFFAFHLFLAYLVDHVSVNIAFAAAAVVSVGLVVSYLRIVTGMRQALLVAGSAQVVFLVLFSYAFFFEGFTGLAITVGAIVTLFVLMQLTARVSWDEVFSAGTQGNARGLVMPAAVSAQRERSIVRHLVLPFETRQPLEFIDVTLFLSLAVREAGLVDGVVVAQTRHTTMGLLINEHEPLLLDDFASLFERLAPAAAPYAHDDFGRRTVNLMPGERRNGHAHCRAALLRTSESVPVAGGVLTLGRWQRVFLVEFDGGQRRELSLTLMGTGKV